MQMPGEDEDFLLLLAIIVGAHAVVNEVMRAQWDDGPDLTDDALARLGHLVLPRVQRSYGCFPCTDVYAQMVGHGDMFRAYTNFTPAVFEVLFLRVEPHVDRPVDVRGRRREVGAPRALGCNGGRLGRPPNMSLRSRFFMFLAALRGDRSILDQVAFTGQNQQAVSDDFFHILDAVLEALEGEISWPDEAERARLEGTLWDYPAGGLIVPILIWDGTIQPTGEPSNGVLEPLMYCSRKKVHGYNHQLCCDWRGRIRACHVGFYGSVHDSACYQLIQPQGERHLFYSGVQTALGDSGYAGCGMLHVRRGELSAELHAANKRIRRHRVLIEFVIGALKNKFKIASRPWGRHANMHRAPYVFLACAMLLNVWMDNYGYLRGAAYRSAGGLEVWERVLLNNAGVENWDTDELVIEAILQGGADDLYDLVAVGGVP